MTMSHLTDPVDDEKLIAAAAATRSRQGVLFDPKIIAKNWNIDAQMWTRTTTIRWISPVRGVIADRTGPH